MVHAELIFAGNKGVLKEVVFWNHYNRAAQANQALAAGGIAALAISLLMVFLKTVGFFETLGAPIQPPQNSLTWVYNRTVWGGVVWGPLFLLPVLTSLPHWIRGLMLSMFQLATLWLWFWPSMDYGFFGFEKGMSLFFFSIPLALLWGLLSGIWLDLADFHIKAPSHSPLHDLL